MKNNFTRFLPLIILLTLAANCSYAQAPTCDGTVPYYVVDLRGNPGGSWISPPFSRLGHCCAASGSDNCGSFQILLDTNAAMVNFEFASGAVPSGVMYYQIDCGPSVAVGSPICLSGSPHYLTFCKPGNNTNTYRVTSIPKPGFPRDDSARIGCSRSLTFRGLSPASVTWTSIYPGAPGAYNSYLTLSDSTHLLYTPAVGAPPYVDYRICGTPIATMCGYLSFCDTVRVSDFTALSSSVTPTAPSFCAGGSGVPITATASGGAPPYTYIWKNSGGTTVGTSSTYTASVAGTYSVEVRDLLYTTALCPGFVRTVSVTTGTVPVVNAGPDQIICASSPVTHLSGSVTSATGGIWTGGAGSFSPGSTSLVTNYTPTSGEISAGFVDLILTSAGAGGGCTNKSDTIHITYSPIINLSMNVNVVSCNAGNNGSGSIVASGGFSPFTYSWSTSPVQTAATATGLVAGTYTVTVSDGHSCTATSTATVTQPAPLNATASTQANVSCNAGSNGSASVLVTGGTTPYSYSWSSSPVQTTSTATGLIAGTYTVTVTDANGCTRTATATITQPTLLNATASTLTNVLCNGGSDGSVNVVPTGGVTPYTYSWSSSPAQTTATATGLGVGPYTVTVTDANSCTRTATATVTQPTTLNATASTLTNVSCNGGTNGSVSVTPSGGTTPYTYSWNSSPVQTASTATGLGAGTYTVTVTDANGCTRTATATVTQPTLLNATASTLTNVSCNGGANGSVSVTPSGGTTPYLYSWTTTPEQTSATATGLVAGTYTVTVTDAKGCSRTASATVTEPVTLSATASTLTNVSCNGGTNGSVSVTAAGGTIPYTYSWSTSPVRTTATVTGLGAGTYTVTVTDTKGCTTTATAAVTQPTLLNATASTLANVLCRNGSNGSVSVTPTGGTTPYTYSWSTSPVQTAATATGLGAGTYTVTVTDANGCTRTATATVTQPTLLNATASTLTNVACNGGTNGSVSVAASGGTSPYVYSWSTTPEQTTATATGLVAGGYTVTVTDANGCTKTASATVTQPTSLSATASTLSNALCNGINTGSVNVVAAGGTTPYTYSWSTSPVQTAATATGLTAGTYSVVVTDAHNCSITVGSTVTQPSTLGATASTVADVLCHNGNNGSVTVSASGGTIPYTYSWSTSPVRTTATVTGLGSGTYVVTVSDANGCTITSSATVTQPTQLNATASVLTNVSCNGGTNGSVSVTPSGGTSPYTYSWSTAPMQTSSTATGLGAGTYTVTVIDANGCTRTATATVTQPTILNATASTLTNVSCNGGANGSVGVTPSGGTTPYVYSWSTTPEQTTATATGLVAGTYTITVTDAKGCTRTASATVTEPTTLNATASTVTNVSCNGGTNGSVSVTPSGGTTPYSYTWSTTPVRTTATVTGLGAGSYTVTVTDAHNCAVTATADVTQPTVLNATASTLTNVSCNGGTNGSVSVVPAGGTLPYTYSWSTTPVQTTATATGLGAGTYSVTVTDGNGCIRVTSAAVTQPTILNATASTLTNVACNSGDDGSVTVAPSGGTVPYTYSWSTSPVQTTATASGLGAGTYTVVITDAHGCVRTATATVTQPTSLAATASTLTNALCNGINTGSVNVSASGGTTPYTYSWSTSPVQTTATATGLTAGTYSVVVTDAHNCSVVAASTVTQPSTLAATASTLTEVSCNGGNNGSVTVAASGGTIPYTYSWSTSPVRTTATVTGLAMGTYVVTVSDANNCTVTTSTTVTQPTMLNATASNLANVSCNGGSDGSVSVMATGGTTPYIYSWNTSPIQTDATATGLGAGVYTVIVTDANGCTKTVSATVTQPTILNATASTLINAACNAATNGSASVAPSGGTSPYTYSWSTSPVQTTATATGLGAGTYTVIVTDANGCTRTAATTVTEPTTLTATASTLTNVSCNSGANGSVNVASSGGTTPYTYSWSTSPVQTGANATGLGAGTYTVTVTDAKGCSATASATVTEPATLDATASTLTNVSCNGGANGSVSVAPGGGTLPYTYSWSTSPVQTASTAIGLGAGTYTVTVTDAKGCSKVVSATVTQPATLSATTSTLTNVACNGGNDGSVDVSAAGGTLPYTYSWSSTPVQTMAAATGLAIGTYTVTVTDANNCVTTATTSVTQPATLTAAASTLTNALCNGLNTGSVTVSTAGGSVPYTYSWSTSPVQTTATATGLPAGNYTVTVTDAHNCIVAANTIVTQPSTLAATASTLTDVSCNGGSNGSVTTLPTGGTLPYTYSWTTTPVQTTASATGLPIGTYTVTVSDSNNCSVTATATVTEPTALAATASVLANVSCNSGANGSTDVAATGGTMPYSYSWSTAPVQTVATATGLTAGTYTVTVTDAHGCIVNAATEVTQPNTLTATAWVLANVSCNGGNNGSLTVVPDGGTLPYSYSWTTSPAQTAATSSGLTAGTYTVTTTDANGCLVDAVATVTEPTVLTATATSGNILCNGGATSVIVAGAGGTVPYSGIGTFTVTAGSYEYVVTDSNGCSVTTPIVVAEPDKLDLTGTSTDASCDAGNDGTATIAGKGGTLPYTYQWDANTGNQQTATATGLRKGSYNVTVTDKNGCTTTAVVIVNGAMSPMALAPSITNASCSDGNTGSISIVTSGGIPPFTYSWSNGAAGMNVTGLGAGEYSITVTDSVGCKATGTYRVEQPSPVDASIVAFVHPNGFNISGYKGSDGSVTANANGGTSPYAYLWSNGVAGAQLDHLTAGHYLVTVTDQNGCIDTASIILKEPDILELPTGFSPNGDGKNDFFVIHGINGYPNNQFVVFNRWGNEVYSADGYNNVWNGSNKEGKDLPDGTYFVVLTINGGSITRTGYVDLRR